MGWGGGSAERNHWRSLPPFENYSCQILSLITAAKTKSCHCKVARMQLIADTDPWLQTWTLRLQLIAAQLWNGDVSGL